MDNAKVSARIFGQWRALERVYPQLAPELLKIEELSSTSPQQAKSEWTKLLQKNPYLPQRLFLNLQWAIFNKNPKLKEETIEENKKKHDSAAHLAHFESGQKKEIENDPNTDPDVEKTEEEILRKTNGDLKIRELNLKANFVGYQKAWDDLYEKNNKQAWKQFIDNYPQKAQKFSSTHPEIKKAFEEKQHVAEVQPVNSPLENKIIPQTVQNEVFSRTPPITKSEIDREINGPSNDESDQNQEQETQSTDIIREEIESRLKQRVVKSLQKRATKPLEKISRAPRIPRISTSSGVVGRINTASRGTINAIRTSQAALQALRTGAAAAGSNPITWIIFGVILLLLILFFAFLFLSGGAGNITLQDNITNCPSVSELNKNPLPGVTLQLSAPESVGLNDDLTYTLSFTYDSSQATISKNELVIYDRIPENTTVVSASGVHDNSQAGVIIWYLKNNPNESSFTLTLKPTQADICIANYFSATSSRGGVHIPESEDIPPSDYQAAIKKDFDIQMDGFNQESLKWAYDKLKDVARTRFISLEKGHISKIVAKNYSPNDWTSDAFAPGSDKDGCPAVIQLVQGWPGGDSEEIFKITLIHEISHVIDRCAPESLALGRNSHGISGGFLEVYQKEGGATYYGQHASGIPNPKISGPNMSSDPNCPDGNPISEDYADMLAYYLNPSSKQKDVCKTGRLPNPFNGGNYPMHKTLAEKILGSYQ